MLTLKQAKSAYDLTSQNDVIEKVTNTLWRNISMRDCKIDVVRETVSLDYLRRSMETLKLSRPLDGQKNMLSFSPCAKSASAPSGSCSMSV